jgi:hypothetical protein
MNSASASSTSGASLSSRGMLDKVRKCYIFQRGLTDSLSAT